MGRVRDPRLRLTGAALEARLYIPDVLRHQGLDAALSGLQRLAEAEMEASGGLVPLYESGARYVREPRGQERWLPPSEVLLRGHGDCEDLAAYRAAELRLTGEDDAAEARVVRSGPRTWHAVVLRGDGSWEDPSAVLGMTLENGVRAPMRFQLRPTGRRDYHARVDLAGCGRAGCVDFVARDPASALAGATYLANEHEMGFLPFLSPLLNIANTAARTAMEPGASRPPARPASQPSGTTRTAPPTTYEGGIIDLARQLRNLANREVARRDAVRAVKLRNAISR